MVINWYGENCFKVASGNLTLAIDQFGSGTGLSAPRFNADIALYTDTPLSDIDFKNTKEDTQTIIGPGEYEVKGIQVNGHHARGEKDRETLKTIFAVNMEGMRLAILGHISTPPEAEELEDLGDVDILFIPAGGSPYLKPEDAAKVIKQIDPKIVIPTLFKVEGLTRKAGDVKEFVHALDIAKNGTSAQDKLTLKKKDLPEKMEVAILSV
jgi:L-ascorbate metabolism protein UlaG (beta-lactamase superfamily)